MSTFLVSFQLLGTKTILLDLQYVCCIKTVELNTTLLFQRMANIASGVFKKLNTKALESLIEAPKTKHCKTKMYSSCNNYFLPWKIL